MCIHHVIWVLYVIKKVEEGHRCVWLQFYLPSQRTQPCAVYKNRYKPNQNGHCCKFRYISSTPSQSHLLLFSLYSIILSNLPRPWQAGLPHAGAGGAKYLWPDLLLSGQVWVRKHRLWGAKGDGTLSALVYYSWVAPVEWVVIQHPNPRCGSICAPFTVLTAGHWSQARYPGAE